MRRRFRAGEIGASAPRAARELRNGAARRGAGGPNRREMRDEERRGNRKIRPRPPNESTNFDRTRPASSRRVASYFRPNILSRTPRQNCACMPISFISTPSLIGSSFPRSILLILLGEVYVHPNCSAAGVRSFVTYDALMKFADPRITKSRSC